MSRIETCKVEDEASRNLALQVVEGVYHREKNWIHAVDQEIPADIATNPRCSWFLATVDGKPAGVIRLVYDPCLELPPEYQVSLHESVDLQNLARQGKFVDIGRFMILPEFRRKILVAIRLMGAAVREVIERNYTHFITDVFQGEPHSPLQFHTKILGFEIIGSHLHGELNCSLTRIILTLDILKAYRRLKLQRKHLYDSLSEGFQGLLEQKMLATPGDQ
jgi:hypothetical protein